MKIRVPVMVQDSAISSYKGMPTTENVDLEDEFFLDGPVSRRVAVLDFDSETGQLRPGARVVRPTADRATGAYDVDPGVLNEAFQQVCVFAMVTETIELYERKDILGRPTRWSFDGPQLLIIPRAGVWANAFYERASRSLQFFSFEHKSQMIHTAMSRDIVAHETGHAILDGIAPDLYDAVTPQSLALHEAIADVTALLMAFQSSTLRETVLEQTNGSIDTPTAFNAIAEEFGTAVKGGRPLRDFVNQAGLVDGDGVVAVHRTEPHSLSQVVSGALYPVMQLMFRNRKQRHIDEGMDELAAAGRALGVSSLQFGRIMLRALDYLPPGEVSFRDYAWAVVASDTVSHPDASEAREMVLSEFVRRGVPISQDEVEDELWIDAPALENVDRETLVRSDWAAFDFVTNHRELFGLPEDLPFMLRPRLDVKKLYYHRGGEKRDVRELIFKVAWEQEEENPLGRSFPRKRLLTVGTTLAIAWDEPVIRARLTHRLTDEQADDRTEFLRRLIEDGSLIPSRPVSSRWSANRRVVGIERSGAGMRVSGTGMMLHVAGPMAPRREGE